MYYNGLVDAIARSSNHVTVNTVGGGAMYTYKYIKESLARYINTIIVHPSPNSMQL